MSNRPLGEKEDPTAISTSPAINLHQGHALFSQYQELQVCFYLMVFILFQSWFLYTNCIWYISDMAVKLWLFGNIKKWTLYWWEQFVLYCWIICIWNLLGPMFVVYQICDGLLRNNFMGNLSVELQYMTVPYFFGR